MILRYNELDEFERLVMPFWAFNMAAFDLPPVGEASSSSSSDRFALRNAMVSLSSANGLSSVQDFIRVVYLLSGESY